MEICMIIYMKMQEMHVPTYFLHLVLPSDPRGKGAINIVANHP